MDKLKMHTPDIAKENYDKLSALFPDAVTETIDGNGKVVRAIDSDVLMQEINEQVVSGNKERYQFTWPDKKQAIVLANTPTTETLRFEQEKSVGRDGTEGGTDSQNIYIEGDNLEALKLLRNTYLGKVKMIYIDPPYNTGNDFIYEDDFSKSVEEYKGESGQYDEDGNKLVPNPESNGRFHTDWLNMIYPRLKVAKDMLSKDGVIFISIDDSEESNLKKILDEIFGEHNCVGTVIWERAFSPKNDAKYFSASHDFILVYAKNINEFEIGLLPRTEEANARYKNPDNDPRGPWTADNMTVKTYSAAYDYPIVTPNGSTMRPSNGRCWFTSQERMQKLIEEGRVYFGEDGGNMPRLKRYLSDVQQGMTPTTIWKYSEVGHNQDGRQELKKIFDGKGFFDGPKPQKLISRMLKIANLHDDSVVVDFFSGSATTAHSLIQLNADDNSNRKFILVQIPELTYTGRKEQYKDKDGETKSRYVIDDATGYPVVEKDSEAHKAGYNTICDIGEERIRRAGKKIKEETGADIDYGFRCFKVDSSNMQDVYYTPAEYDQNMLARITDNIKPDRTPLDLLVQVMLELKVPLDSKVYEEDIAGKKVFSVENGYLIACFDKDLSDDVIRQIAERQPFYAVFRDSSFASDSVEENATEIFKGVASRTGRQSSIRVI